MKKSPVVDIIKRSSPAVVTIVITEKLENFEKKLPPWEKIFFPEIKKTADDQGFINIGNGSGILTDAQGLIVTNRHVVDDKDAQYMVIMEDREKYPAEILARDPINDIAILRVAASRELPFLELGDSGALELGEEVVTIGNALGELKNTVSTGVVAGLSRYISSPLGGGNTGHELRGLIQTDAAINPGNSGGPMLNMEGEVVGINTAIIMGAQNIGFAIPINNIKDDLRDLRQYGRIVKPSLGIRYLNIDEAIKKQYHLPVAIGALVVKEPALGYAVVPGGPAEQAGIKEGDIIASCDGVAISEDHSLQELIQGLKSGDTVQLHILRNGEEADVQVQLGERK